MSDLNAAVDARSDPAAHRALAGYLPPIYPGRPGAVDGAPYAGTWRRVGALLVDGLILSFDTVFARAAFWSVDDLGSAVLAYWGVIFVVNGAYTVTQEALWGQTIGKRALGIKVVRDDGGGIGVREALIRYVFLFLSPLALLGLVPLLMVIYSGSKKRLGDEVAGTVVVRTR